MSLWWHLPGCTYYCASLRQEFVDLDVDPDGRLRADGGVGTAFGLQIADAGRGAASCNGRIRGYSGGFCCQSSVSVRGPRAGTV